MALLNLAGVGKSFGAQRVLAGVSLQLQRGEKAGLVGPNGSGKSTLLKIIAGELEADGGSVHLARGASFGYLPQEPGTVPGGRGTLRQCLEEPLRPLLELKAEIASLEQAIAAGEQPGGAALNTLLTRYGTAVERFEALGGYSAESRLEAVARGLGFTTADLDRPLERFSGGEKTRAGLATLLLRKPDLLLLDEPTNFLDLAGLEWLERYLRDWPGAVLAVSHDRYFLDRVAGRVFALQGGALKSYHGNYSYYAAQLAQERLSLERAYRRQQALLAKEETLIRKAKSDERSKRQARSRRKRLDKLERVELPPPEQSFKPGFDYTGRSGKLVVGFEAVSKAYGPKIVFSGLSFEIHRGDRVAVLGPNGAGKTTLLKLIAGALRPDEGTIRLGASVRTVYFTQEQEQLNREKTVLEEITAVSDLDLKQARNHLGRYLFRGDDVFKKVGVLSGGEKSRLALARLSLSGGNCLLMDEPTSHLDLPALEEMEQALAAYPGTLIVVSHDRYFLSNLVNRVFFLSGGGLTVFNGSFRSFLETREKEALAAAAPGSPEEEAEKRQRAAEYRTRLERQRAVRKLQERLAGLEEAIAAAEDNVRRLEQALSDPGRYGDREKLSRLGAELEEERAGVAALLEEWEETARRLEQLK